MRTKRLKRWFRARRDLLTDITIIGLAAVLVGAGGLFLWISTLGIPDLSAFEERRVLQSTKIYDRTGEILLYDLHQDVTRTIVPYEDISRHIKNATVAVEDDTFFEHWGVRPIAILRSMVANLQDNGSPFSGAGGSTITQQVIKNSILVQEKTLTRKIKEAILAIRLEQVLTKEAILSHYLNESPYGGTIYGVEEASQAFFGKSAAEVSLAEAAYLAALPQAPTYYSPYGNNREALDARKNYALDRMYEVGFITEEERDEAKAAEVEFQPQAVTGIRAPHFVMYIREQLAREYGEDALAERGFRVITTLDWELQQEAERIVAEYAATNEEKYNARNAGMVAIDPKTGDVLVMVGSRDYFDEEIDGNFNVALANRQPGSSIKPYVYASAFTEGYTPDTILFDVRTQFSTACEPWELTSEAPCYAPNNYNNAFKGPISMRNALAQSLNIPAVKTLYLTGIKDAIKLATDMGLSTLNDPDRLGLTLVLGGGEVKLLEHVGGYGVFANEGVRADRRSILRIEDVNGEVIKENDVEEERVLDRDVALMVTDILADNVARTPLWGANSLIHFPNRDVAAKSGSTNNLRDAWIMGYTPNLAVGAWVGNNNNEPMGGGLSGLITTPMWRAFMDVALEKIPEEHFAEAPAIDSNIKPILRGQYIDTEQLVRSLIESDTDLEDLDLASLTSGIHSILHYVSKDDPRGPYPSNPERDGQYAYWEYGVQAWKEKQYGSLLDTVTDSTDDILDDIDLETTEEEDEPDD